MHLASAYYFKNISLLIPIIKKKMSLIFFIYPKSNNLSLAVLSEAPVLLSYAA